jgi:hypothetical protein
MATAALSRRVEMVVAYSRSPSLKKGLLSTGSSI